MGANTAAPLPLPLGLLVALLWLCAHSSPAHAARLKTLTPASGGDGGTTAAPAAAAPAAAPAAALPAMPATSTLGSAARIGRWTMEVEQQLPGVPIHRAFDFWWDVNSTRRFIPAITSVQTTRGNANFEAFTIGQLIPFPVDPTQTVTQGAVVILQRTPTFISARTRGLVKGPVPTGGWIFLDHLTNFTATPAGGTRVNERATHTACFSAPQALVTGVARNGAEAHRFIWAGTAAALGATKGHSGGGR